MAAETREAVLALVRQHDGQIRTFGVKLLTPESLSPYIGPHILNEVSYVALGA